LHGSYYNIDTSINIYGKNGVILTSNLFLEFFTIFNPFFFINPEVYHHIMVSVDPALMEDVRSVSCDLEQIAARLYSTGDPRVMEVWAMYKDRMQGATFLMDREAGRHTYGYKSA
jgi:hypothetical protein